MGLRNRTLFDKNGNVLFITTTVMNFERIFSLGNNYSDILISSLKYLIKEHNAYLLSYVIMPSHIHFIIALPTNESISDFMRDFKKYTSTKIRKQLESDNHAEIIESLRSNAIGKKNQMFKLWMDRFDDVVIYSEEILKIKINYIHNNPVKANLVSNPENWIYSSAGNYLKSDNSIIEVYTDWDFDLNRQDVSPDGTLKVINEVVA
ncbi:MAG TPA: transposase [Ignavibacteria bacterium]|nr:transposase [Ignavibacteria bacterium]